MRPDLVPPSLDDSDPGGNDTRQRLGFFFAEGRRCLRPLTSLSNATDEEMETTFFSSSEVFHTNLYCSYQAVRTGPPSYQYTEPLAIGRYHQNRPSAVDFGRRRSIEGEKGNKKKEEEEEKKCLGPSSPAHRHRLRAVLACTPSSPAGRPRAIFLPHREKDQGDIAEPLFIFFNIF
ncbi:hypothetical protein BHM03_00008276 [Ensete ventricosum]|nr:hypothetical protein BHM03_00008276 [Ensete ventricosum]